MPVPTNTRLTIILGLLISLRMATPAAAADDDPGLIPVNPAWQHPRFVTNHPGPGQTAQVDPPRLSWSYLPDVVPGNQRQHPATTFRLQIANNPRFRRPAVDVETPWNWYNALAPLGRGTWYWRVRAANEQNWREPVPFEIAEGTPTWDRSDLLTTARRISRTRHPRFGPALAGHASWAAWNTSLEQDRRSAWAHRRLLEWATAASEQAWYRQGLPASDRATGNETGRAQLLRFETIARECTYLALAYRLTGDQRFAAVGDRVLELAAYPPGGLSSPESHGSSIKFTTRIALYLALCYDWLQDDWSSRERRQVRDSLAWRIALPMTDAPVLANNGGSQMMTMGVAIEAGSHPYQNLMWLLPAALIMAGAHDDIDAALEPMLHYLVGVTGGAGNREAWNEGPGYGLEKGGTMLRALLFTRLLAPNLQIERNPFIAGYGDWLHHLLPLGTERLAYGDGPGGDVGDYAYGSARGVAGNAYLLGVLTGDGRYQRRHQDAVRYLIDGIARHRGFTPLIREPWLLFASLPLRPDPAPEAANAPHHAVFAEAGWAFARSQAPTDWAQNDQSIGVMLQARPRGGYSHSYRSDGSVAWHAFGRTLSSGGGTMLKMNPHSVRSISHNVMLIDGVGQRYNLRSPDAPPWVSRIMAARTLPRGQHWVADLTPAYPASTGLERWQRHVLFLDDQTVVLIDDCAAARPVRFSWLWQVDQADALGLLTDAVGFGYQREGISAQVRHLIASDAVTIEPRRGRAAFANPLTGDDHFTEVTNYLEQRRGDPRWDFMKGNLDRAAELGPHAVVWTTNATPTSQWTLVTVLTASTSGQPAARVQQPDAGSLELHAPGRPPLRLRWAGSGPADLRIDLDAYRSAAVAASP